MRVTVPPLFGLRGTVTQLFRMKRWIICCHLRRLNYNKTVFGTTLSQTPESNKNGYFRPIFLPSLLRTQRRLVLLLNWYPTFKTKSYASRQNNDCMDYQNINITLFYALVEYWGILHRIHCIPKQEIAPLSPKFCLCILCFINGDSGLRVLLFY